ncbi:hypothetical protein AB0L00_09670 [Actinoallomurus sp. NPDC052308]|uniref:hypothetical protein n=1 Tax=Actinoallomurus sp. NPDC052308 TaxID=3155530 RepID=UPI0034296C8A
MATSTLFMSPCSIADTRDLGRRRGLAKSGGAVIGGAAIAGGSVFWGSGYWFGLCDDGTYDCAHNNKLYAFSVL